MQIDIDDFRYTLRTLENVDSFDKIYTECLGTVPRNTLHRRDGFKGLCLNAIMFSLEPLGLSQRKCLDETVEKTKEVFRDFLKFIEDPTSSPSSLTKHICVLLYSPKWCKRISNLNALFKMSHNFSADDAAKISAPLILDTISTVEVPWETLENVWRTNIIGLEDERILDFWIKEMKRSMKDISPNLFFMSFYQMVRWCSPGKTERECADGAFALGVQLHEKYKIFIEKDSLFEEEIFNRAIGKLKSLENIEVYKENLDVEFSEDLSISFYQVKGDPTRSVLISGKPMVLGMAERFLQRNKLTFPLLSVLKRDVDGDFLIVEGLVGSLKTLKWEKKEGFSLSEAGLVVSLVNMVKGILSRKKTPKLSLGKFWMTRSKKICLFEKLDAKHGSFSMYEIEQFINKVCDFDSTRKVRVMHESNFFDKPYARVYMSLLKAVSSRKMDFSIEDAQSIFKSEDIFPTQEHLREFQEWISIIARHFHQAERKLQKEIPIETLREALPILQQKLGFLLIPPPDLFEHIASFAEKFVPKPPVMDCIIL